MGTIKDDIEVYDPVNTNKNIYYSKVMYQNAELTLQLSKNKMNLNKEKNKAKLNVDEETVKFIKDNHKKYNLHVVSGSDGEELRYLCKALKIDDCFLSINGSPTHKNELVKNVLAANQYSANETILIGDSVNDYDAAEANGLNFYGYNNPALIDKSKKYLENYVELL